MTLEQIVRRIGRIGRRLIRWWTPLRIAGVALLVLAFLVGTLGYLNEHGGLYLWETPRRILAYLSANVSTELASIAITILIVDALYQHRETEREKKRLILQMGSPDNAFAREAVRALSSRGWLRDGSLKSADLLGADLQGAFLGGANLQKASLGGANLQNVFLMEANLQEADLLGANLQGACLWIADLQEALLMEANLQGADLGGANLRGADLRWANLQGADLTSAKLYGAKLSSARLYGTKLSSAELQGADLQHVRYNNATIWPTGFTPPPEALNIQEKAREWAAPREAKGYSLWLMPSGDVYNALASLISQLSGEFFTPNFEPHVTLIGSLDGSEEDILSKTSELATLIHPLSIGLTRVDYLNEYFRCLFISVETTHDIMDANFKARQIFSRIPDREYMPHLSLMYGGSIPTALKEEIIAEIGHEFDMSFEVTSIHLCSTSGEPRDWYRVEEFTLAQRDKKPLGEEETSTGIGR